MCLPVYFNVSRLQCTTNAWPGHEIGRVYHGSKVYDSLIRLLDQFFISPPGALCIYTIFECTNAIINSIRGISRRVGNISVCIYYIRQGPNFTSRMHILQCGVWSWSVCVKLLRKSTLFDSQRTWRRIIFYIKCVSIESSWWDIINQGV